MVRSRYNEIPYFVTLENDAGLLADMGTLLLLESSSSGGLIMFPITPVSVFIHLMPGKTVVPSSTGNSEYRNGGAH